MKNTYRHYNLNLIANWSVGEISQAYCLPKQKDLNKSRLISGGDKTPNKKILKAVSAIFFWLLKHCPYKYKSKNIHKLKSQQ